MDKENNERRLSMLAAAASAFEEQHSSPIMSKARPSKKSHVALESKQDPKFCDSNFSFAPHNALTPPAGMVRFPCRSRNSSADHNSLTAYFCIPINTVMHGIELICSHPKCQLEGVKFRFCAHCRIPAAKRNFSKRHMHGIPHALTALPLRTRTSTCTMQQERYLNEDYKGKGKVRNIRKISSSRDASTSGRQSIYCQEGALKSACEGPSSPEKRGKMPPESIHASQNEVPQSWIDLYHARPNKILIENGKVPKARSSSSIETKLWLQRVLAEVDPNINVKATAEKYLKI